MRNSVATCKHNMEECLILWFLTGFVNYYSLLYNYSTFKTKKEDSKSTNFIHQYNKLID